MDPAPKQSSTATRRGSSPARFGASDLWVAETSEEGRPFLFWGSAKGKAIKIVDPETDAELPFGEDGILMVTGGNVMIGYLGRPEETAKVVRDGWYDTGDIGHMDEDGFITLTGRLSRFAKIGGEMVPLEKIEELHIRGVLAASAIAWLNHKRSGTLALSP